MDKLVVLDYSNSTVHIYDVMDSHIVDDEYVENLGYDTTTCYWISGKLDIIAHKGLIM